MKVFYQKFIFFTLLALMACTTLPYKDDTGFLVSAQANSPEFPVYINGTLCKDLDGNPGLCSKRIGSTDDIKLHFDAQAYAYDLTVSCSSPITVQGASVASGQAFDLTISNAQMQGQLSFVCIGEVFPQDRSQAVSAKWEIRIVVRDANYVAREGIYVGQDSDGNPAIILGQYARSAWVFDNGEWSQHKEDTIVTLKGDPTKAKAYSESFVMRYNYFNFDGPVASVR
jgi:hypothetical protein